jgi:hypothetical protein
MSCVIAWSETLSGAAKDSSDIGSAICTGDAAASAPITGVAAAGADELSAAIAAVFSARKEAT